MAVLPGKNGKKKKCRISVKTEKQPEQSAEIWQNLWKQIMQTITAIMKVQG
jgi:hypothetical protein